DPLDGPPELPRAERARLHAGRQPAPRAVPPDAFLLPPALPHRGGQMGDRQCADEDAGEPRPEAGRPDERLAAGPAADARGGGALLAPDPGEYPERGAGAVQRPLRLPDLPAGLPGASARLRDGRSGGPPPGAVRLLRRGDPGARRGGPLPSRREAP